MLPADLFLIFFFPSSHFKSKLLRSRPLPHFCIPFIALEALFFGLKLPTKTSRNIFSYEFCPNFSDRIMWYSFFLFFFFFLSYVTAVRERTQNVLEIENVSTKWRIEPSWLRLKISKSARNARRKDQNSLCPLFTFTFGIILLRS